MKRNGNDDRTGDVAPFDSKPSLFKPAFAEADALPEPQ
jgi:hypothetical protein